jgi:hypothetical protein
MFKNARTMKEKSILIFLLLSLSAFSQNFEGEIIYKNICKSNKPDWKIEYCQMITDSIENFHYKNGNYKYSVPNNQTWTIFKQSEKKVFRKTKKGQIFWSDANSNNDSITKITVNKKVLKVLGYDCNELIIESLGVVQKYYYSSKLAIDPKLYKNHPNGNLYNITLITKAIPLKTIFMLEDQGLILESTALKINKGKLDDTVFLIPRNGELLQEGKY